MKKKIAVLVRERQSEALRMSIGLSLADDEVSVFIMDRKLEDNEGTVANLEAMNAMGVKIYTNSRENSFQFISTEDIARKLVDFDIVIPY
jgi:hypothetical protein